MNVKVKEVVLEEPQQKEINGKTFPLILELDSESSLEECCKWVKENKSTLQEKLVENGAFLLRGFPIQEIEAFHTLLLSFGWDHTQKYQGGGGPRNIVLGPIYNSTDSPAEFKIPFHHEMAYLSKFPEYLIFYCDIQPAKDGETPILLSNELLREINEKNPQFVEKVKQKGVRYIRTLCDKEIGGESLKYQKSWQDIFETTNREEAEAIAKNCGSETVEWLENGGMKLTTVQFDGVVKESRTGKETWFNAICLLHPAAHKGKNTPWDVVYGDFSSLDETDVLSAMEVLKDNGVGTKWLKGDMLVVDNRLALHSRNFFTPPRRILAAFAS